MTNFTYGNASADQNRIFASQTFSCVGVRACCVSRIQHSHWMTWKQIPATLCCSEELWFDRILLWRHVHRVQVQLVGNLWNCQFTGVLPFLCLMAVAERNGVVPQRWAIDSTYENMRSYSLNCYHLSDTKDLLVSFYGARGNVPLCVCNVGMQLGKLLTPETINGRSTRSTFHSQVFIECIPPVVVVMD